MAFTYKIDAGVLVTTPSKSIKTNTSLCENNFLFFAYYVLVMILKSLKSYIITGIIFVSVLGTLSHFLYEWSGNNFFVGLFVPVNESIWEHMKLLFFPMLIYSIFIGKLKLQYPYIYTALIFGNLIGTFSMPVFFYTYTGVLGYNISFIDIAIFYICVIIAYFTLFKTVESQKLSSYKSLLYILNITIVIAFMIFTVYPPNIGLFMAK